MTFGERVRALRTGHRLTLRETASRVGIWPVIPMVQYFFTMSWICGTSLSRGLATAYFMLTGHPVFPGNRALDIVFAHAKEKPVPPSKHVAVPPDLEQVVLRCLEKDPADRYGDVRELERALAGCRDAQRWSSQAAADWWRQDGVEALADTASGSDPAFAVTTIAAAPIPASARMATT